MEFGHSDGGSGNPRSWGLANKPCFFSLTYKLSLSPVGWTSMRLSNAAIFTKISTALRCFPAVKYLSEWGLGLDRWLTPNPQGMGKYEGNRWKSIHFLGPDWGNCSNVEGWSWNPPHFQFVYFQEFWKCVTFLLYAFEKPFNWLIIRSVPQQKNDATNFCIQQCNRGCNRGLFLTPTQTSCTIFAGNLSNSLYQYICIKFVLPNT